MKRYLQIPCLILLALSLFACSAAMPASPEPQPTPSEPAEGFHPLTTRTGIEDVDKVVDAVATGDVQILRSLIQFTNTKCTKAEGMGGPPKCREGEAEGTPVEVLPILGSEGHFIHKEDIETWPGVQVAGLYAVYEVSTEIVPEEDYPAGKYAVMFVGKENRDPISLRVTNGRIVRVDYLFVNSLDALNEWLQRESSNVILAPVK